MDSYRAYYEYPPSQAAIHVLPASNSGTVTPVKTKRSWGNFLRITGRLKKDREPSSSNIYSPQPTIYSPPFNLPQSYGYVSPNYSAQNVQLVTTPPFRDPTRNQQIENKGKYLNYNGYSATYSRGTGNVVKSISPIRESGKNTVRYTDWFGSVVGRKPTIRPPLPLFYGSVPLSTDKNIPTVTSWDNYVSIQAAQNAVEIPAIIPIQGYNVCMCPDQLFSTKSKKKRKCKNCGKKYGTVKNATAIGSVTRIRPAIPPNFYNVPVTAQRSWPQTAKTVYAQPLPLPLPNKSSFIRDDEEDEDSPPPTPETIRSIKSGRSGKSNESNSTITPDILRSSYSIPPPPSVPLPSIPKVSKNLSHKDENKRASIISSTRTAYDFIEKDIGASLGSDTDELSDNAVDNSWNKSSSAHTNTTNSNITTNENRVSVISIGSNEANINYRNNIYNNKIDNDAKLSYDSGSNKVKIYNNPSTQNVIKINKENSRNSLQMKPSNKILNGYKENNEKQFLIPEQNTKYQTGNSNSTENRLYSSQSESNLYQYSNGNSSHFNRKFKAYDDQSDIVGSYNGVDTRKSPERDSSKVVSIAGQRILLDKKQSKKCKTNNAKYFDRCNELSNGTLSTPDISDWDSLQEFVSNVNFDANKSEINKTTLQPKTNSEYLSTLVSKSYSPNFNYYKNNELKRNIISADIREIIPEEEEEDEDEDVNEEENNKDEKEQNVIEDDNDCENDQEIDIYEKRSTTKLQPTSDGFPMENGYHNDERFEDKEENISSTESTSRLNGYQPTLSELLQVKSILKRPNSLDTSSETDSDFYLPTFSEFKQNMRKKKSVQFRQSDEVTLVEGGCETKGRKVSSIKAARKERGKEKGIKNDIIIDLHDIYERNAFNKQSSSLQNSEVKESFYRDSSQAKYLESNEDSSKGTEFPLINGGIDHGQPNGEKEGSGNLRRTLSHRQTVDVSVPSFCDTYRLRQQTSRPSILHLENSPAGRRKPTRKAPPVPKTSTSPLRPTVPPPPPPSSSTTHMLSMANYKDSNKEENDEEACYNDSPSSLSSTSLSPPPSPPPPLPSSPPPLPSSSPPPLDDDDDDEDENDTLNDSRQEEMAFSSFIDPKSTVSISARAQQIQIATNELYFQNKKECLPPPRGSSMFNTDDDDNKNIATIKGRVQTKRSTSNSSFQSNGNNFSRSGQNSNKSKIKNKEQNGSQRLSFLSSMMEETDTEERFSDHIYEELPSLPSSPTGNAPVFQEKSIFDGASKYEILEFLQDARNRVDIAEEDSEDLNVIDPLTSELSTMGMEDEEYQTGIDNQDDMLTSRYMDGRSSNRSSNSESSENSGLLRSDKEKLAAAEVERTDSGVGSETSKPLVTHRRGTKSSGTTTTTSGCHVGIREGNLPLCDDCDTHVEERVINGGLMYAPLVCRRCSRRRQERKEILCEIMETEVKYGRDLKVMMDQFCRPMRVAALLSRDQLERIFLNIDELIEYNRHFSLQLRDAYEIALDQGDEDFQTVNVAKLFLQASPMLHAFQNYCVRQGAASILLQSLEKERELLRIFLKVSQMENTLLRRMNLHSFLMVPVQRVTKYPLLLARLYKTTPPSHSSREDCRRAREKIELFLQHINKETKETSPTKLWRRISMSVGTSSPTKLITHPLEYDTSLKLRKVVLEILEWSNEEACIVREGRLLCLPPESTNWTRRGRTLKMATVQMVLVTLGRPKFTLEEKVPEDGLVTPCNLGIKQAAILAFKDHRLTKTALVRDPWLLSHSVITWDAEGETECFEITDLMSKETFIFKDRECVGTEEWFRSVQFHALSVGSWRRRRPALANIMINGASRPSTLQIHK